MPPTSSAQSEHSRRRLKLYLAALMHGRTESRTRIGSLVGASASRASDWINGKRLLSPEKAFDLGNALRRVGWPTSGIEFLWACAYWPEVLSLLKYIAAQDETLAVRLYSWLPHRMLILELNEIRIRLKEKFDLDPSRVERYANKHLLFDAFPVDLPDKDLRSGIQAMMELDPGAREIERYFSDASESRYDECGSLEELRCELTRDCSSNLAQEQIEQAWERFNNGELEQGRSFGIKPNAVWAIARFEMHVIDAVIEASSKLNDVMFPSYVVPRIWRMAASWLYEIGKEAPAHFFPALPDNFVNVPEVNIREREHRQAIDDLEEEAARNERTGLEHQSDEPHFPPW
jgi:hypothetical protein